MKRWQILTLLTLLTAGGTVAFAPPPGGSARPPSSGFSPGGSGFNPGGRPSIRPGFEPHPGLRPGAFDLPGHGHPGSSRLEVVATRMQVAEHSRTNFLEAVRIVRTGRREFSRAELREITEPLFRAVFERAAKADRPAELLVACRQIKEFADGAGAADGAGRPAGPVVEHVRAGVADPAAVSKTNTYYVERAELRLRDRVWKDAHAAVAEGKFARAVELARVIEAGGPADRAVAAPLREVAQSLHVRAETRKLEPADRPTPPAAFKNLAAEPGRIGETAAAARDLHTVWAYLEGRGTTPSAEVVRACETVPAAARLLASARLFVEGQAKVAAEVLPRAVEPAQAQAVLRDLKAILQGQGELHLPQVARFFTPAEGAGAPPTRGPPTPVAVLHPEAPKTGWKPPAQSVRADLPPLPLDLPGLAKAAHAQLASAADAQAAGARQAHGPRIETVRAEIADRDRYHSAAARHFGLNPDDPFLGGFALDRGADGVPVRDLPFKHAPRSFHVAVAGAAARLVLSGARPADAMPARSAAVGWAARDPDLYRADVGPVRLPAGFRGNPKP